MKLFCTYRPQCYPSHISTIITSKLLSCAYRPQTYPLHFSLLHISTIILSTLLCCTYLPLSYSPHTTPLHIFLSYLLPSSLAHIAYCHSIHIIFFHIIFFQQTLLWYCLLYNQYFLFWNGHTASIGKVHMYAQLFHNLKEQL